MEFPIHYVEPVFRPPSEAKSLLLQLTIGCSHNKCGFCAMYKTKKFQVRSLTEVTLDIERAADFFTRVERRPRSVFLCDGNALAAGGEMVASVADLLNGRFAKLSRISLYANASDVLAVEENDLSRLAQKKVNLVFLGLESGNEDILRNISKGNTAEEMVMACERLRRVGIRSSVIAMLGLGGKEQSLEHCLDTAAIISRIAPDFLSFLTITPINGTPYHRSIEKGAISPLSTRELLYEIRSILAGIHIEAGRKVEFRANHVSNFLPLAGKLPDDGAGLLRLVDAWIKDTPDGVYLNTDPLML